MRMISLFATLALAFSVPAFADTYKIDPAHTSIVFKISHLGFSHVYGMIPGAEGKFTIDEAKPEKSSLELTLKADQITTNDKKRDEHLHSPDFFNVKQFPVISFKSKTVKKSGKNFEIAGDLTMHGVTKPVTFTFNQLATGKDPWGNVRTGGDATFKVKRSDFGMTFMNEPGKVGDE
ncbi:MAG: YceI family protein, partial [Bdellovibrionales bacterium]